MRTRSVRCTLLLTGLRNRATAGEELGRIMAMSSPSPKTEPNSALPAGWGWAAQRPGKRPLPWRLQLARLLRYSPSPVLVGVGAAVVAVVVAGWLTHGLWGPGLLPGDDTMAHLVRAEFGARWLARY